jgi:hypothetical protein
MTQQDFDYSRYIPAVDGQLKDPNRTLFDEAADSFSSSLQNMAYGAVQLTKEASGKDILPDLKLASPPAPEQTGSPGWIAQQIGSGAAFAIPMAGLTILTKGRFLSSAATVSTRSSIAEAAIGGAVTGFALTPATDSNGNDLHGPQFWNRKVVDTTSMSISFATMAGIERLGMAGSIPHMVSAPSRVFNTTVAGYAGGLTHAGLSSGFTMSWEDANSQATNWALGSAMFRSASEIASPSNLSSLGRVPQRVSESVSHSLASPRMIPATVSAGHGSFSRQGRQGSMSAQMISNEPMAIRGNGGRPKPKGFGNSEMNESIGPQRKKPSSIDQSKAAENPKPVSETPSRAVTTEAPAQEHLTGRRPTDAAPAEAGRSAVESTAVSTPVGPTVRDRAAGTSSTLDRTQPATKADLNVTEPVQGAPVTESVNTQARPHAAEISGPELLPQHAKPATVQSSAQLLLAETSSAVPGGALAVRSPEVTAIVPVSKFSAPHKGEPVAVSSETNPSPPRTPASQIVPDGTTAPPVVLRNETLLAPATRPTALLPEKGTAVPGGALAVRTAEVTAIVPVRKMNAHQQGEPVAISAETNPLPPRPTASQIISDGTTAPPVVLRNETLLAPAMRPTALLPEKGTAEPGGALAVRSPEVTAIVPVPKMNAHHQGEPAAISAETNPLPPRPTASQIISDGTTIATQAIRRGTENLRTTVVDPVIENGRVAISKSSQAVQTEAITGVGLTIDAAQPFWQSGARRAAEGSLELTASAGRKATEVIGLGSETAQKIEVHSKTLTDGWQTKAQKLETSGHDAVQKLRERVSTLGEQWEQKAGNVGDSARTKLGSTESGTREFIAQWGEAVDNGLSIDRTVRDMRNVSPDARWSKMVEDSAKVEALVRQVANHDIGLTSTRLNEAITNRTSSDAAARQLLTGKANKGLDLADSLIESGFTRDAKARKWWEQFTADGAARDRAAREQALQWAERRLEKVSTAIKSGTVRDQRAQEGAQELSSSLKAGTEGRQPVREAISQLATDAQPLVAQTRTAFSKGADAARRTWQTTRDMIRNRQDIAQPGLINGELLGSPMEGLARALPPARTNQLLEIPTPSRTNQVADPTGAFILDMRTTQALSRELLPASKPSKPLERAPGNAESPSPEQPVLGANGRSAGDLTRPQLMALLDESNIAWKTPGRKYVPKGDLVSLAEQHKLQIPDPPAKISKTGNPKKTLG